MFTPKSVNTLLQKRIFWGGCVKGISGIARLCNERGQGLNWPEHRLVSHTRCASRQRVTNKSELEGLAVLLPVPMEEAGNYRRAISGVNSGTFCHIKLVGNAWVL